MEKLKINLYGESWKQLKIELTPDQIIEFEQKATFLKMPLHQALNDPFFYYKLALPKIKGIDNLKKQTKNGLINSTKNQIEIWFQNRKVQKFKINELNNALLLFPLFSSSVIKWNPSQDKGYYLEQRELGLIGSYELMVNSFDLDQLHFQLFEYNKVLHLENITYQQKKMILKKQDTLITFQNSFEIK